ncbi:hypothetical protein KY315_01620 [Candidatus Woesearchaeota archaeon]|nr:hypothetical protein [Candidatus Woesearchaeota archaeon]
MGILEIIIAKASELNVFELLQWLPTSGYLAKLTKDQLKKVYSIIRQKNNLGKFAFVPNAEEYYALTKLADKSVYRDFKKLLKGHWGVDVVRTGLYILSLERKGEIDQINLVKQQVFANKQVSGLRLIGMVTEGVIKPALDYLKELKEKKNFSPEDLNKAFEDLLNEWEKITIFVKSDDFVETIFKKAKNMVDQKKQTFFIFAKGKAIAVACAAIVRLQKEEYLLEKGYVWFAETDLDTTPPSYYCAAYSSLFLM